MAIKVLELTSKFEAILQKTSIMRYTESFSIPFPDTQVDFESEVTYSEPFLSVITD